MLKLPSEEKLELVYAIWNSIRDDVSKSEIPEEHKSIR
ncbi:MAG: addiction module protein [bacterium]